MRRPAVIAALAALVGAVATACGSSTASDSKVTRVAQATPAQLRAAGLEHLPLAPPAKRVDLDLPSFSRPTEVTNPLNPISRLHSAIFTGHVGGERFKTETTLLPQTRIVNWPPNHPTETLVSQYTAYVAGRLEEVALDYYAQADDGSVWYFGEDVFNYENGMIADTEGTWLAGREGPAAMIMPAHPKPGDVYRSENVPGLVFEEVTIGDVDRTVAGPTGEVRGALIGRELHQDGEREDKTFAPGYGEFFTGAGGDVEAMALAIPRDATSGAVPADLAAIASAWATFQGSDLPPRLRNQMSDAVQRVSRAAGHGDARRTATTALDVAQASLDLQLRHRPQTAVDRERFGLWARRLVLDASSGDESGTRSDLATLEWIRDRFAQTLDAVARTRLDATLVSLRTLVTDGELRKAARTASTLLG